MDRRTFKIYIIITNCYYTYLKLNVFFFDKGNVGCLLLLILGSNGRSKSFMEGKRNIICLKFSSFLATDL